MLSCQVACNELAFDGLFLLRHAARRGLVRIQDLGSPGILDECGWTRRRAARWRVRFFSPRMSLPAKHELQENLHYRMPAHAKDDPIG